MEKIDLFEKVIENILEGDQVETAYTLRMLADEIEEYGVPDKADVLRILNSIVENEEEEYIPRMRSRESSFEDFERSMGDEVDSLFDPIDEDD